MFTAATATTTTILYGTFEDLQTETRLFLKSLKRQGRPWRQWSHHHRRRRLTVTTLNPRITVYNMANEQCYVYVTTNVETVQEKLFNRVLNIVRSASVSAALIHRKPEFQPQTT